MRSFILLESSVLQLGFLGLVFIRKHEAEWTKINVAYMKI